MAEEEPERHRSRSPIRNAARAWALEGPPRNRYDRHLHIQMGVDLVGETIQQFHKLNQILAIVVDMQSRLETKAAMILNEAKEIQEEVVRADERERAHFNAGRS